MFREILCLLLLIVPLAAQQLPPDVASLKSKRDARISEINRAYAAELDKFQKKAMQNGDLEAANIIQKEIESVAPIPSKDAPAATPPVAAQSVEDERLKPLVGVWKRDFDNWIWTITDTKNGILNGNEPFTMNFDRVNNRVIVVSAKWINYFTFTANPDVVYGRFEIGGKTTRYKLQRIK